MVQNKCHRQKWIHVQDDCFIPGTRISYAVIKMMELLNQRFEK